MKKRILFVCLGNICRSPAAEAIFKKMVKEEELIEDFIADSAGLSGWHTGEAPDHRMIRQAGKRGYILDHRARQFDPTTDFDSFDLILGMDDDNIRRLRELARNGSDIKKIRKMVSFCKFIESKEVPDPYMESTDGFELVLDILEDGCRGLLTELKKS
jgi:protein-tyrosine phosphatase